MPDALALENLSYTFGAGSGADRAAGGGGGSATQARPLLSIASLRVAEGEQVLVRGASGAGKSTLLYVIAGLVRGAIGRVLVAGKDILTMGPASRDRWRGRHIGMIFQTFNLLSGFSALENVLAALKFSDRPGREHAAIARELLARLGIERVEAEPDALSVGQQQRVAVARALAVRPALVLADEPTASLDPASAHAAMDVMQSMCRERGAALVCTSHDPSMAGRFARVVDLSAGGAGEPHAAF